MERELLRCELKRRKVALIDLCKRFGVRYPQQIDELYKESTPRAREAIAWLLTIKSDKNRLSHRVRITGNYLEMRGTGSGRVWRKPLDKRVVKFVKLFDTPQGNWGAKGAIGDFFISDIPINYADYGL